MNGAIELSDNSGVGDNHPERKEEQLKYSNSIQILGVCYHRDVKKKGQTLNQTVTFKRYFPVPCASMTFYSL